MVDRWIGAATREILYDASEETAEVSSMESMLKIIDNFHRFWRDDTDIPDGLKQFYGLNLIREKWYHSIVDLAKIEGILEHRIAARPKFENGDWKIRLYDPYELENYETEDEELISWVKLNTEGLP